jgi:hypothetical protein
MGCSRRVVAFAGVLALGGCSAEAQPETSVAASTGDLRGAPENTTGAIATALSRHVTGPITVTSNQVIRLSAIAPVLSVGPRAAPPDPCRVELSFVDAAGAVQSKSRVEVAAGVEQHLDFSPSAAPSNTAAGIGARATLVPLVTPLALAGRTTAPACLYSVQLLDKATGASSFVSTPKLFHELDAAGLLRELEESRRPAALEFGFVTLAQGQTARLNLVNRGGLPGAPPDPCRANVAFVDLTGVKLEETQVDVAPNQGTAFELSASRLTTAATAVRAVLSPLGTVAAPPDPCRVASLEVIDDATGASRLRQEPALILGERDSELSAPSCPVATNNGACPTP